MPVPLPPVGFPAVSDPPPSPFSSVPSSNGHSSPPLPCSLDTPLEFQEMHGPYRFVNTHWDDKAASALDPVARLVYRSNCLGRDQRITNTGGGNTSAKLAEKDPADRRTGRGSLGERFRRRPA